MSGRESESKGKGTWNEPHFARLGTEAWVAALKLGVPQALVKGESSCEGLVERLDCDGRGMAMLLDALVAIDKLERTESGTYRLGHRIRQHLALPGIDPDTYFIDDLVHAERLNRRWSYLAQVVATGRPGRYFDPDPKGDNFYPHLARNLFPGNYLSARMLAERLKDRFGDGQPRILDVGAGSAAWSLPFVEQCPAASAVVLDFEAVLPVARHFANACGVADRYSFVGSNLREHPFGNDEFDLVVLGHICHSEGIAGTRDIFRKSSAALRAGGFLLLVDFLPDVDRLGADGSHMALLFALNMLVQTDAGGTYTRSEYSAWAKEFGMDFSEMMDLPGPASALLFRKKSEG